MITLTIGNSFSKIEGLSPEVFKRLRKVLSYKTDPSAAFFGGRNYPRERYCIDNKGNFPTGLSRRVSDFLEKEKLLKSNESASGVTIIQNRVKPPIRPAIEWIGVTPWKAQSEALKAAMAARRGTIVMPTGTGKTLVIAMIAAALGVKTLIVVPNLEIKKQLIASLNDLRLTENITVENIDSSSLYTYIGYDCLIIDEAHHVSAKTYQRLNAKAWKNIYYRFFLTATPFRTNAEETLLFEGVAGRVIYQLDYKTAVKEGYIVPVESYYIEMPKTSTDAFTWAEVYGQLVVSNSARNIAVASLLQTLDNAGVSTLCLVKEVKHGENIKQLIDLPFVNGQDENSRTFIKDFNCGKIKTILGTEGMLSEGVDTKACEYVIVAGLGKARGAFQQKVGRAVRKYPGKESAKIILIRDKSHRYLTRHFNAQCAILKEVYGTVPIKLNI